MPFRLLPGLRLLWIFGGIFFSKLLCRVTYRTEVVMAYVIVLSLYYLSFRRARWLQRSVEFVPLYPRGRIRPFYSRIWLSSMIAVSWWMNTLSFASSFSYWGISVAVLAAREIRILPSEKFDHVSETRPLVYVGTILIENGILISMIYGGSQRVWNKSWKQKQRRAVTYTSIELQKKWKSNWCSTVRLLHLVAILILVIRNNQRVTTCIKCECGTGSLTSSQHTADD